jgi:integrase
MPLTAVQVEKAKPRDKRYRMFDGRGLHLEVAPAGGKWWRFRYRFDGKARQISLGTFPDVTLKDARDRRDEARRLVANGADPADARSAGVIGVIGTGCHTPKGDTFGEIAERWFAQQATGWSAGHTKTVRQRLDNHVLPHLRNEPITAITSPRVLEVLRKIEAKGALEATKRTRIIVSQVFRFGIAEGVAERDPAADVKGALSPVRPKHFAAATDPRHLRGILLIIDGYEGSPLTWAALQLQVLTFVRPGELRHARWDDVDLDAGRWTFEASKTGQPHIVPLSRQAAEVFAGLHPITGHRRGGWCFPSLRSADRPMSNNTVNAALRRLGVEKSELTGHGFRATARTLIVEQLGYPAEVVEMQLAHRVRDPLGAAYNRTTWLDRRTEMMQRWADWLDELRGDRPRPGIDGETDAEPGAT